MSRAVRFPLLALSLFCLVACNTGKHKTPIRKSTLGRGDGAIASKLSSDILSVSGRSCLRVGAAKGKLVQANTTYYVYTSDIDLGEMIASATPGQGECMRFRSIKNEEARALLALRDLQPDGQSLAPQELLTSPLTRGLFDTTETIVQPAPTPTPNPANPAIPVQNQCPSVNFVGDGTFTVVCSGAANKIMLKSASTGQYRSYVLGKSEMTVTTYSPVNQAVTCKGTEGSGGMYQKNSVTIAWTGSLDKVKLRRPFAQILAKYLDRKPQELVDGLTPPTNGKSGSKPAVPDLVGLSYPVYDYILSEIQQSRFKVCK